MVFVEGQSSNEKTKFVKVKEKEILEEENEAPVNYARIDMNDKNESLINIMHPRRGRLNTSATIWKGQQGRPMYVFNDYSVEYSAKLFCK